MAVHFETRDDFLKAPLCVHTLAIQLDNLTLEIALRSYGKQLCVFLREAVERCDFINRADFLRIVKHSLVGNMGFLPNTETTKALLVAQHFRLVPPSYECEECDSNYVLSCRRGRYQWRGPRYDGGCPRCNGKEYNAAAIGFFKGEYQTLWLDKLDALVMWVKDYSRATICIELHDRHHETIDGGLPPSSMSSATGPNCNLTVDSTTPSSRTWKCSVICDVEFPSRNQRATRPRSDQPPRRVHPPSS